MTNFYVNTNAQPNGDHEVHRDNCPTPALPHNRLNLGYHSSCVEAVRLAKETYRRANGCKNCNPSCHTS